MPVHCGQAFLLYFDSNKILRIFFANLPQAANKRILLQLFVTFLFINFKVDTRPIIDA